MPVLSPHRSSASALAGTYRSTFSSSALDRPYCSSASYSPRIASYSERYTSRSYTDADGRRIFTRSGSITEDGVTTRFREESRENSLARRDSSARDSIRENSTADYPHHSARRESSLLRNADNGRPSAISVLDSVAELRNRYSPANYVPSCMRARNDNLSRSKSINDIGLPPPVDPPRNARNLKVTPGNRNNTAETSDGANDTNTANTADNIDDNANANDRSDRNGNSGDEVRTSVAELRRRFGDGSGGKVVGVERAGTGDGDCQIVGKSEGGGVRKGGVEEEGGASGGSGSGSCAGRRRANESALYIPAKNYRVRDVKASGGETTGASDSDRSFCRVAGDSGEDDSRRRDNDISSPKVSSSNGPCGRSTVSPSLGNSSATTNSLRRASDANGGRGGHEEGATTVCPAADVRTSPAKTLGLNGLKNIGNTCFMNSVIQCLSNTKLLLEYVRKDVYLEQINTNISNAKGALIKSFGEVIKELWSEDAADRVVNTSSLKSQIQRFAPRFIGYAQQDAQEFLRYLLEGLHEDVNRVTEKPKPILTEIDEKLSDNDKAEESWRRYLRMDNSWIVECFVGQLKSTLKCTHCGHCSVTFDPFWDLSLPIPQRAGQVRLSQCLEAFTKEETLDGDEKPTCSKCKERRKCTKSFTIQKFPKILVIHLKRFSLAERFRGKLSVTVDFPLEGLDMSNYAADSVAPCRYNLYAVSNHSGTTYSGHYTAYCRHPYTRNWHEYNDSRVSSISPKSIVSGEAYVLFYEQDGQKSHL